MKAFFITTTTNETCKHYESFLSLGHEVQLYIYKNGRAKFSKVPLIEGAALDAEVYAAAKAYAPNIIVYIGACGGNTPSIPLFKRLNAEVAPVVHFCSDAEDDPWWPLLVEYDKAGCFALQVSLDGSPSWPLRESQLTALTVVDPAFFEDATIPHAARSILFGFAGNVSGGRSTIIKELQRLGLNVRVRDTGPTSYPDFAKYLGQCRMTVNFPWTGSGRHLHVKGRVIEAGYAGVLLLERGDSPTKNFFTPGVDYIEYKDAAHVRSLVDHYAARPEESQEIAERLRAKVAAEHCAEKFWGRILDRVGLAVVA